MKKNLSQYDRQIYDILSESEEGWAKVENDSDINASVDKINAFVNKTIESKKRSKKALNKKQKINYILIGIIFILIIVFIAFSFILEII